jgi:hypothetical protein
MNSKSIFIAPAVILLIIIFSFISFHNRSEIVIKAHLYDVAKQVNDLNNWKKWDADISNSKIKISGDYTTDETVTLSYGQYYSLHHVNPLEVSLKRNLSHASTSSLITISPSNNDDSTYIAWSETITIYTLIARSFSKNHSPQNNLNSLKHLLEDKNYKYGFFIKLVPVKDTLILTAEAEVTDNTSTHIVTYLYNSLYSFIKKNRLPAESRYFYKTILNNNKVAVGIPVYKQLSNSDKLKFLQLPANGRLVEGSYQGSLADKQSIYKAFYSFMSDQHLKQVAQPLEQYYVADTLLSANSHINIKIFYPVF